KSQRLEHASKVGHTAYKPSAANLTEGVLKSGAPAAFTDDLNLVRGQTGAAGPGTTAGSTSFPQNAARGSAPNETSGSTNESNDAAVQTAKGLNAFTLAATHGFVVEPPDQGLCAGNGYVVEMVNLNLQVFSDNLTALQAPMVLETFFNEVLAFAAGDVTIQGDPRCYWDANTHRWFLSQLVLDLTHNTSRFDLAVSTTSSPLGDFNLYSLDNTDNSNPGCPCFGDQPTMGANHDAIFISTNEFSINNPVFNGAVLYTIDKEALADGADSANTVVDFIGLDLQTPPTPGLPQGTCTATGGLDCWASIRPTSSPTSGDTHFGGVEYLLSALDFANASDSRIGVWAVTNTSSIRKDSPSIGLQETTLNSEKYIFPAFARQKAGPIPLGDSGRYSCEPHVPSCPHPTPQTEGPIQTNDDQIQSAVYADGLVWGGLDTTMPIVSRGRIGIAYFAVSPHLTKGGLTATIAKQGYLVKAGNDVEFPSIGVDSQGHGVVSFTLSGPDFFPSSAYATIDRSGVGPVKVAALGQSPQDGFTEYEFRNGGKGAGPFRPRWGDYSASVAVGQTIYFSSEYIQYPNCSDAAFTLDTTCGGTRSRAANWGTSINKLDLSANKQDASGNKRDASGNKQDVSGNKQDVSGD
ncbi:MAG: hypothetical protein ACREOY_10050, partial [Candidatus Dormibacteraceae bacterium]